MKIVQCKYINSVFSRGEYSPLKEQELIGYIQLITRSLINDASSSNEIGLISQTFALAIEDFIVEYGIVSSTSRKQYTYTKVLFLITSFLDKLDTLTRLGLLNEDIAMEKFRYVVEVFEERSVSGNERLDSLG